MKKLVLSLFALSALAGCAEDAPTFSILPETDVFYQSPSTLNNKLDILWVIDNSGSMHEEQTNLANNFNAFINDFVTKGYDFQIAVTVSDAWRAPYINLNLAKFRDGVGSNHSGVFVITPSTPNLIDTFVTNIMQGTNGSGDERAFQSFKTALDSPLNAGFVRSDGYLAIIIVSDEDDFSHNGSSSLNRNYSSPALHSVQSYVDYLDQKTQSTSVFRRYSVSTITIPNQACYNQNSLGIIGHRHMQLAELTDGVVGNICDTSFADSLEQIQENIAELSTQFYLSRIPDVSTIVVKVNGQIIPEDAQNGWTYNQSANSIVFHGTSIPPQGSQIIVDFDPIEIM